MRKFKIGIISVAAYSLIREFCEKQVNKKALEDAKDEILQVLIRDASYQANQDIKAIHDRLKKERRI